MSKLEGAIQKIGEIRKVLEDLEEFEKKKRKKNSVKIRAIRAIIDKTNELEEQVNESYHERNREKIQHYIIFTVHVLYEVLMKLIE